MREYKREFFISLFGDYIFLILYVCAIGKKDLKPKRKNLFDLRTFLPIAGRREGEERETKRERTKKEQYTHQQIVIYLVGALPGREKEYCFL